MIKSLTFFFILTISMISVATPRAVLITRHGEELQDSNPNLSPRGWQRAKALPSIFSRPEFKDLGTPELLYAADPTDERPSMRSVQTLTYVAQELNLKVRVPFARGQEKELAKSLLEKEKSDGKFVMVTWSHATIQKLAEHLGVKKAPEWNSKVFDRMWLLVYTKSGVKFYDLPERLLPGDSNL
jgi:hypothetical protein